MILPYLSAKINNKIKGRKIIQKFLIIMQGKGIPEANFKEEKS